MVFAGCGGEGSEGGGSAKPTVSTPPAPVTTPPSTLPESVPPVVAPNRSPTITGTAPIAVIQGREYYFAPSSTDADGDPLTFLIEQLPSWAKFDASTGAVRGTPGAGDVGSTTAIRIGVSDGKETSWLPSFSINVLPPTVVITSTKPESLEWDRLGVGKRLYLDDTPTFIRVRVNTAASHTSER
jgi:hypothetical protein